MRVLRIRRFVTGSSLIFDIGLSKLYCFNVSILLYGGLSFTEQGGYSYGRI